MIRKTLNKTPLFYFALKPLGFFALLFFCSLAAHAQNTKGDRPTPNQKQVRESKFKTVRKKKRIKTRDISGRRLRTRNKSSASRANARWPQPTPYAGRKRTKTDRAAEPRGRIFNTPPRNRSRAWKGDISGHKLRVQSRKSQSARTNVYPQKGPYVNNPAKKPRSKPRVYTRTASGAKPIKMSPRNKQRAWKGNIKGGPVGTPSRSGKFRKIYPQTGPSVNYSSKRTPNAHRSYPNQAKIENARRLESGKPPKRRGRIYPRSASSGFFSRGKRNVYWGKYSKGEKAFTRDITGRKLRTRNFRTPSQGLFSRDTLKFFGRRPQGDRSYSGRASSGFRSATKRGQQAWQGDISGRKLRRNRTGRKAETAGKFVFPRKLSISGKQNRVGKMLPGGGYKSRSGRSRFAKSPLPPRAPGIGAEGINYQGRERAGGRGFGRQGLGYTGNMKSRRPLKGGGSVSGKLWNNKQNPIPVRTPRGGAGVAGFQGNFRRGELHPGFSKQGADFAGNIKARRPLKGGGSVSGKLWNNDQTPIQGRASGFSNKGIGFAGNMKTRRPQKGGGSVSGKLWNNDQTPIQGRAPGYSDKGIGFAGNMKTRRPQKGGGSISGKIWNNDQTPIQGRASGYSDKGIGFAGNMKTKRPQKGGGSISGKIWNNKETPLPGKTPSSEARKASGFPGNYKMFDLKPSHIYQGEEFTGYIKAKKPKKGGESISGKLWNNNEEPIQVRLPGNTDMQGYSGKVKLSRFRKEYIQNPNASAESIKKHRPDKSVYEVAGLQVKVRQGAVKQKPNVAKGSLPGIAPSKSSVKASEYARGVKVQWNLKHNPNSAAEALKGRAPDRAYAKIGNYQGNVKMHKYNDHRLHPDAQFAHSFRDNVKEERTIFMNIKLFWAKMFRKGETQPDHLKEKLRRPRYDKREKGLWYE